MLQITLFFLKDKNYFIVYILHISIFNYYVIKTKIFIIWHLKYNIYMQDTLQN